MNKETQNIEKQMTTQINWVEDKFRLPKDQWFLLMEQKEHEEQEIYHRGIFKWKDQDSSTGSKKKTIWFLESDRSTGEQFKEY